MYVSDALGPSAMFNIVVVIFCIGVCWWALQSVRFDVFLKQPDQMRAKILQIVLAIVLGYQLGRFIIEYSIWSSMLGTLF